MDFKFKQAANRYADDEQEERVDDVEPGEINELAGFRKWVLINLKEFILETSRVDESFMHEFEILEILKGGNFEPIQQYLD